MAGSSTVRSSPRWPALLVLGIIALMVAFYGWKLIAVRKDAAALAPILRALFDRGGWLTVYSSSVGGSIGWVFRSALAQASVAVFGKAAAFWLVWFAVNIAATLIYVLSYFGFADAMNARPDKRFRATLVHTGDAAPRAGAAANSHHLRALPGRLGKDVVRSIRVPVRGGLGGRHRYCSLFKRHGDGRSGFVHDAAPHYVGTAADAGTPLSTAQEAGGARTQIAKSINGFVGGGMTHYWPLSRARTASKVGMERASLMVRSIVAS